MLMNPRKLRATPFFGNPSATPTPRQRNERNPLFYSLVSKGCVSGCVPVRCGKMANRRRKLGSPKKHPACQNHGNYEFSVMMGRLRWRKKKMFGQFLGVNTERTETSFLGAKNDDSQKNGVSNIPTISLRVENFGRHPPTMSMPNPRAHGRHYSAVRAAWNGNWYRRIL